MIKLIIFDFNRTIFDPEKNIIEKSTFGLLRTLLKNRIELALITTYNRKRLNKIKSLKLKDYFKIIIITKKKTKKKFKRLVKELKLKPKEIIIIGDCLEEEIRIGNSLRIKTIWLNNKSQFRIKNKSCIPWITINNLKELKLLLKKTLINNQDLINEKENN